MNTARCPRGVLEEGGAEVLTLRWKGTESPPRACNRGNGFPSGSRRDRRQKSEGVGVGEALVQPSEFKRKRILRSRGPVEISLIPSLERKFYFLQQSSSKED